MAQEYIKIRKSASDEWLVLPQPDSGALSYDFETTYTEDSGRTQTGAAVVSPLFTVEALGYSRASISKTMLSQILKIIAKGQQFQLHYFSAYYASHLGRKLKGGTTIWQTITRRLGRWRRLNWSR